MALCKSILLLIFLVHYSRFLKYSFANHTENNLKIQVQCPATPASCKGVTSKDGRVVVKLSSGYEVMCDTETDGGGWIILQRRINGKVDFYRGWEDYKFGFGDFNIGEFYLGNEIVHQLTVKRRYELRIDLRFNNSFYFACYSQFRLYGEAEGYRLKHGNYSGNATDGLNYQTGQKFSTFDKDNDSGREHCAVKYQGAWWYNDCHESHLNGKWASKEFDKGLKWGVGLTGYYASVTWSEMKIREI